MRVCKSRWNRKWVINRSREPGKREAEIGASEGVEGTRFGPREALAAAGLCGRSVRGSWCEWDREDRQEFLYFQLNENCLANMTALSSHQQLQIPIRPEVIQLVLNLPVSLLPLVPRKIFGSNHLSLNIRLTPILPLGASVQMTDFWTDVRDPVSMTLVRSSPGLIAALIFIKHCPTWWTVKGVCAWHALYIKRFKDRKRARASSI